MKLEVRRGKLGDKPKFQRLMQFYLYDFSEVLPLDLDADSYFKESVLDSYFTESGKAPFLVVVDDALAGFVLVSEQIFLPENAGGRCIKEFFIMRRYRRRSIGKQAAAQIFSLFPGRWEVRVVMANQPAERFWDAAMEGYGGKDYRREIRHDELWHGWIFSLSASGPSLPTLV